MSIGKNIAKFRSEKGMTQTELGEKLGVTNQAVSKWESEVSMPDVMLLPELAEALYVSLNDLYDIRNLADHPGGSIAQTAEVECLSEEKQDADKRIVVISVHTGEVKIVTRYPSAALRTLTKIHGM